MALLRQPAAPSSPGRPRRARGGGEGRRAAWLAALAAGMASGGCRAEDGTISRPVISVRIEAGSAEREVHPWRAAVEEGAQAAPLDGTRRRPVRLVEVRDVDRLVIDGDRGRELVRVEGLGGADPDLPAPLNEWLEEVARPAAEAWLRESGTELFERAPALFQPRGWPAGPSFPDPGGLRFVSLERRASDGSARTYHEVALERGWSYPVSAYVDDLALDPRLPFFQPETEEGLFALPCVREMQASYAAESERVTSITGDELQTLGESVLDELAPWLDWRPAVVPRFVPLHPQEADGPFREALVEQRARQEAWVEHRAEELARAAGPGATYEVRRDLPPIEEAVADVVERVHGFSPAGDRIWMLRKPCSERLYRATLAHELVHQYQEEVTSSDGQFPLIGLPLELGEAHAEWLAMTWRAEVAPGERNRPLDYRISVRLFDWLVEEGGVPPNDVVTHFLENDLRTDLWNDLRNGELSLQEWCFRELDRSDWEGLVFEDATTPEGIPRIRIRNARPRAFDGQFHGVWLRAWKDGEGQSFLTELTGAPFNLLLPGGATVLVRLADDPLWADGETQLVAGLCAASSRP